MGVKSAIDLLPEQARNKIDKLLQTPAFTQQQVADVMNAFLVEIDEEPVMTKRIVNRYAARFKEVMAKKRESSEVVKQWVAQVGEIPDGDFGRAIVEIVRTLSFEMSLMAHEKGFAIEDLPAAVKMLKDLAFAVEKVEKAASENEKRDAEIRKKAREDAAKTVTASAKAEGVSEATIERIRRDVLGMAA